MLAQSATSQPATAVRPLAAPVLASADEELDVDTAAHDTGSSYTGTAAVNESAGSGLMRYVQAQPGRAALMALGAGALLAMLWGRRLRRRRD